MKRWFISDTHFSHKNIIKYAGRPYETVEEMNRCLIENCNLRVDAGDQVFFLGDFGLGDVEHLHSICSQLRGDKICIRGNHDRNASYMMRVGFNLVLESAFLKIGHNTMLSLSTFLPIQHLLIFNLIFNYMVTSMRKDPAKSYLINSIYALKFGITNLSLKKLFLVFWIKHLKMKSILKRLTAIF